MSRMNMEILWTKGQILGDEVHKMPLPNISMSQRICKASN